MKILALIPARGGSKGLPGKNIMSLNGHPLIAYSIAAGLESELINRVICSTDSEEIAKVALDYGAEVPFLRPKDISADLSTDLEVFKHCIDWLIDNESYIPDLIVQLRPTSPLRTITMINEGINILKKDKRIDSVRTVSDPEHSPYKMWTINSHDFLEPLLTLEGNKEPYNTPRQILPEIFAQTGTIDVVRSQVILEDLSMSGKFIKPLYIDPRYFIDIDTMESLKLAELLMGSLEYIKPKNEITHIE